MNKIKEFIAKAKAFYLENPRNKKLVNIAVLLAIVPLTIISALTVQNLIQRAGGGTTLQIVNAYGVPITSTSSPNVYLNVNLPSDWVILGAKTNNYSLAGQAYAQTNQCLPPYSGLLGCYSSFNQPAGSACTSSCTTSSGQTGKYCYTSTKVGNKCTTSSGQNGTCNNQGSCITSAPTPTPQLAKEGQDCGTGLKCAAGLNCSGIRFDNDSGEEVSFCVKSSAPTPTKAPTPTRIPSPTPIKTHAVGEPCFTDSQCQTFFCKLDADGDSGICAQPAIPTKTSATPSATPTSIPPTPTPSQNVLKFIYIENIDSDGSTGGSTPFKRTISDRSSTRNILWKLNDLLQGQSQASRIVQVTLISDNKTSSYATTINLINSTSNPPASYTITIPPVTYTTNPATSNKSNIPTAPTTTITNTENLQQLQQVNFDLNSDGKLDKDDTKIFIDQFGFEGENLPTDFNKDGVVNQLDYNLLLRNLDGN